MGQVAYQAKAYAGFSNTKRLGVFLLPHPTPPPPLDGMLIHRRATSSIYVSSPVFLLTPWARTRTIPFGNGHTNREATGPRNGVNRRLKKIADFRDYKPGFIQTEIYLQGSLSCGYLQSVSSFQFCNLNED